MNDPAMYLTTQRAAGRDQGQAWFDLHGDIADAVIENGGERIRIVMRGSANIRQLDAPAGIVRAVAAELRRNRIKVRRPQRLPRSAAQALREESAQ